MSTPSPSPAPAPKDKSSVGGSGSAYVWADSPIGIGPFNLGFGTRVFKDIAVGILAAVLLILGIILIAKPDIQRILKNTIPDGDVPIPIPV